MKKLSILAAMLLLTLSGCTKNDSSTDQTAPNAIAFVNLNDKVTSRAANDAGSDFGIYAVYRNGSTYGTSWLMDNTVINGTNYSYSPTKFWPTAGVVDFYSYAPASSTNLDLTTISYGDGSNINLTAAYTVATTAQEDFTVATPALDLNYKGQAKTIDMLFGHALSQVKFNVTMDAATIDAANYTLVVNNITLDMPFDKNDISFTTQAWGSAFSRSASYASYTGATNNGHYNVLPQTLTVPNSATITLNVTLTDKITGEAYVDGNLKPIVLDGTVAGFTQFEKGKAYTFAVEIGTTTQDEGGTLVFDPITFNSQLTPWTPTPITVS